MTRVEAFFVSLTDTDPELLVIHPNSRDVLHQLRGDGVPPVVAQAVRAHFSLREEQSIFIPHAEPQLKPENHHTFIIYFLTGFIPNCGLFVVHTDIPNLSIVDFQCQGWVFVNVAQAEKNTVALHCAKFHTDREVTLYMEAVICVVNEGKNTVNYLVHKHGKRVSIQLQEGTKPKPTVNTVAISIKVNARFKV